MRSAQMFFCQSRMHCSLIVSCTDRKGFSFAKRFLVAVFSGVILLVCGAPSILYGQDAPLFETWTKVESSPETKAYTEALKAGGAFDGKHQAHFLENVLPQLELQSNRPQIERVRKRIRDVFLVPITSPAAFDAAQAAVVLYASQAAASDDFDMAVRVNAVLLIGDLRTAKQEPWPSAVDAIVTIATNIDLPLAIRASAMPGLFRHASSAGNPEGRKAITAAAFTIIAETAPDTQQTAHEWLQSKAMASLRVIGSPLTESDATNILAALNNSQAGLNLRVRCASLLGALADRDTKLDLSALVESIKVLATTSLLNDEQFLEQRILEKEYLGGTGGGSNFGGGIGPPGAMGMGMGMGSEKPRNETYVRQAWRLSVLAEALEAEDPKSKGKGLLQLVPATEMQLAEDVTLLATVLRDCAYDMTAYADSAALSKCLDRLLPERIEEREAAEQAEAAAMAAQENATETDASPEETVPVEESSAPGETEEPAKKPAVKKPSPKKSEP